MNIEELKRLAEAASDYDWNHMCRDNTVVCSGKYAAFIAAVNPAAVLELIDYAQSLESTLRGAADDLKKAQDGEISALRQRDEARKNDYHAMSYLADCRFAVGDDGKRMLPEFVEYLRVLKQQRDELLAALKNARELVEDWGAYASEYMQEKHDLVGDIKRLNEIITKVEA